MTKKNVFLALIILLLPLPSLAQHGDFGLGVIIGEPTGLSWKIWTGGKTGLAGAAAWSLGRRDAFHLHADYLFHNFNLFSVSKGKLPFYYGLGFRLLFHEREDDNHTRAGVRIPLGIEYIFASPSLGAFIEIVPILDLSPRTDFDLNAAIGIRYYF